MIKTNKDMKNTQSIDNQVVKTLHTSENAKKLGEILYNLEMLSIKSGFSVEDLCKRLTRVSKLSVEDLCK